MTGGQTEPDSRERARILRTVAHRFRELDLEQMTGRQLAPLFEVINGLAEVSTRPSVEPENVHQLPTGPGEDAIVRRARLALEAFAANAEKAADEMDRRLDEEGVPPAPSNAPMTVEELTVAAASAAALESVAGNLIEGAGLVRSDGWEQVRATRSKREIVGVALVLEDVVALTAETGGESGALSMWAPDLWGIAGGLADAKEGYPRTRAWFAEVRSRL